MVDVVLFVGDSYYSESYLCRICHEEEWESSRSLEAPCAYSGTVKYAHRDCIQRWCNEKGNAVCELCLQKFEPDYTAPPKRKALLDTTVTIRESVEVPRREIGIEDPDVGEVGERQIREIEYSECSSPTNTSVSACRKVAFLFTLMLLARHILAVLAGTTSGYPFTLVTLVIIKSSGIILPMYVLIRLVTSVYNNIRHHQYQEYESDDDNTSNSDIE